MHMHTHVIKCVLDFGPVYIFWLFSFERCNGIVGDFQTNNRSNELQFMRKFVCDHPLQDIPLPESFLKEFEPRFKPVGQTGTLGEIELELIYSMWPAILPLLQLSMWFSVF